MSLEPSLTLASFARDHRWVRLRLLGWIMIGLWQTLELLAEFVPLMLETPTVRIARNVTGLIGLILVAWGFERIVAEAHRRQGERHGGPALAREMEQSTR
jgi:hypothetical protein